MSARCVRGVCAVCLRRYLAPSALREAVSPRLGAFLLSGIAPLFGRSGGGGAGERAGPLQLAPASFAPNGRVVLGLYCNVM